MRDFGLGKKSLDERMREEAGFLVKEIDRTEGKPRDLTQLLPFVTGNIICSIIFGDRYVRIYLKEFCSCYYLGKYLLCEIKKKHHREQGWTL